MPSYPLPNFDVSDLRVPKPEDADLGGTPAPQGMDASELAPFPQAATPDMAPPPMVDAPPQPPIQNDVVRRFIEAKLKLPNGPDPQLVQAQREEAMDRALHSIGKGFANSADAVARNAAGFASAIGGHGFSPPPAGSAVTPPEEAPSPVQRYLAAKKAQQDESKANLDDMKAVMDAQKVLNGQDPNSLEAKKLGLEVDKLQEEKTQHEALRNHWKDAGDLAKQKQQDLQAFRQFQEKIGWARLDNAQKKQALDWFKANLSEKRLAQGQERLDRDAEDRSIAGEDGAFSKQEAKDLGQQKGNVSAAVQGLNRLKELRSELVLNGALPTDKEAEFESLYHSLSPVLNGAEFKTAWNKAHGENFKEQLRSPQDMRSWLNQDYFDKQADEVIGALQNNYKARVDAARKGPTHPAGTAAGQKITMSDMDRKALAWAQANPKDPRAMAILKKLGAH